MLVPQVKELSRLERSVFIIYSYTILPSLAASPPLRVNLLSREGNSQEGYRMKRQEGDERKEGGESLRGDRLTIGKRRKVAHTGATIDGDRLVLVVQR